MKKLIRIEPISAFEYHGSVKVRWEIEYYSDGTNSVVSAQYFPRK